MAKQRRRVTTSNRVQLSVFTDHGMKSKRSSLTQIRASRKAMELDLEHKLSEMASLTRQQLAEASLEVGEDTSFLSDDMQFAPIDNGTQWMDVDELDDTAPVIDEALRHSVIQLNYPARRYHRKDERTRTQRQISMHQAWQQQLPELTSAYLQWKYALPASSAASDDDVHSFEVRVVGVREYSDRQLIRQTPDQLANVALIQSGLLGCSPSQPTVAITLECLELYHQLRRRQSSFSIQAMTKVLCALHNVTYLQPFRNQFAIAFDIYLNILRQVETQVNQALGRNDADWRILRSCPPCGFTVDNEPLLIPSRLHAMDGNFSAKRVDGAGHTDSRSFYSPYLINPSDVDKFKDDVRDRPGSRKQTAPEVAPIVDLNPIAGCTENFTAANAFKEDTVQVFEQTGLFICACRHRIVESFVEMRHSGELAKYGLATVNRVLDTFKDDQTIGSDIGCAFQATVSASSIAQKAALHNLSLAVNAFHGHTHNRPCQLRNHPLYSTGLGLEDLETCERIFAASNSAARLIRHSSYFHWLQFITLHFDQWDRDKYLELSNFLYNNYKQALAVKSEFTPEVEHFKQVFGFQDEDFESWRIEELQYLTNLRKEPVTDILATAYVESLEKLKNAQAVYGSLTTTPFLTYLPSDFTLSGTIPRKSQVVANAHEAERRSAVNKLELAMNVVDDIERRLGVVERWTEVNADYQAAWAYLNNQKFIRVVEELEGLVVQRLFELSKANLAGTGYKMRKHISKAITRRSAAIRSALDKYNKLAPQQNPRRPTLEYAEVASYAWLGEFTLLKYSRHDINEKPWSLPTNREMATKYFKIIRAREEIHRLNIEIRRLDAWVDHEDTQLLTAAESNEITNPTLAAVLHAFYATWHRVNNIHRARLSRIYSIEGYSGIQIVKGPDDADGDLEECGPILPEEDDDLGDEIMRLGEYIDSIQ